MSFELPPIVKLAQRLQAEIEQAVCRWARNNKYAHGQVLRDQAMEVTRLANRAWRDRSRQFYWTSKLLWAVDDLKLSLQLGMAIKAFSSFAQFEALARIASELGQQCGGWHRQQHQKRQNAAASLTPPQRPQILSTQNASPEAHP